MSHGRRRPARSVVFATIGLACLLVGCTAGGGGFDGTLDSALQAVFVPADPSPGPGSVSMAAGAAAGSAFDVEIRVTGIDDLFGVAFRVQFDPAAVAFRGLGSDGSVLIESGVVTDFRASLADGDPSTLLVSATRQGPVAGVNVGGSARLITLGFTATRAVSGSPLVFGPPGTRQVTVCATPTAACSNLSDGSLSWPGGGVSAN